MTLEEATERLNTTIVAAEDWLFRKKFGVSAFVQLDETHTLRFSKQGKVWKLILVHSNGTERELLECSRRHRVLALCHLQELLCALADAREAGVIEINEVCDEALKLMESTPNVDSES